ncbi:MAG: protein phosphatase 2C domain-containing protein [Microbacteriaceae bacterium]|nr:protein phosphatase 2C domain-containing protein [Microbacteriaceae bacterium]
MSQPKLKFAARSHAGLVRELNEDAVLAQSPCFLVADGVGGWDAGDRASQAALQAFEPLLGRVPALEEFRDCYVRAQQAVKAVGASNENGSGSTLAGVVLVDLPEQGYHWLVCNIGDSRVYHFAAGQLQQVTLDHTLRDEMLAAGMEIDSAELPGAHIITKALGTPDDTCDTWLLPLETGDRLLVCSDGVTVVLDDELLVDFLAGADAEETADDILAAVLQGGAPDNVSLIVVDVVRGAQAADDEAAAMRAETADLTGNAVPAETAENSESAPELGEKGSLS